MIQKVKNTDVSEFVKNIKKVNSKIELDVVGHCMFTGEPILSTDLGKEPNGVGIVSQQVILYIPGTNDSVVIKPNILFYKTKALSDVPVRAVILKQIGNIMINYMDVQEKYLEFKKKEAIEAKHEIAKKAELEALSTPKPEVESDPKA